MREVANEYSFCVLIYMNSYIFHIYCILSTFKHIFNIEFFTCLTLSLADTYWSYRCHHRGKEWPNAHTHTYEDIHAHKKTGGKRHKIGGKRQGVGEQEKKDKCTILVIQQMPTNCIQANNVILEVLPHIILYPSPRRPQIIRSRGHVRNSFLDFRISNKVCLWRPRIFFPKIDKNYHEQFRGIVPRTPSLRGCAPPTHQDGCQMSVRTGAG